jgi:far upstream element-binding protein
VGTSRTVECPKQVVGRVIGKGGETIKNLQRTYNTSVQIDQTCNPCRITIAGHGDKASACERAVVDIIEDRPSQASMNPMGMYPGVWAAQGPVHA